VTRHHGSSFRAGTLLDSGVAASRFSTTAWSVVAGAQGSDTAFARDCVALLVERYWRPVYRFIRCYTKSRAEAEDLTQGFFTLFLEKGAIAHADRERGRFRTFMLAAVKRYLAGEYRIKKRKDIEVLFAGIRDVESEPFFEPAADESPEDIFMRNWAKCVLENCVARLRKECRAVRQEKQFEAFEARYLSVLPGGSGKSPSRKALAENLSCLA